MVNLVGLATDRVEAIADARDDPEARPAGSAEPHYTVSPKVTVSRDRGFYVYHIADDQLGQGSSFGNARAWAETKGSGDMLNFFSIEVGTRVLGGMAIAYLLPFCALASYGRPLSNGAQPPHGSLARIMPSAPGAIHLHPAYQQHEFVIGDGLHVLETFFLPRTGMDDPAAAHTVVALENRTPHPIGITIVASLDLRGETPRDMIASYDAARGVVVAYNASHPDWVRVFGSMPRPKHYWVTPDAEGAYSPGSPLPNQVDPAEDPTAALQFDVRLLPGRQHKLRLVTVFSPKDSEAAWRAYERVRHNRVLKETIQHYAAVLQTAALEMPDALLTQGVQWAKACLLRPMSRYAVGEAVTNDPGRSTHLVGRDTAWYVHGCDFVIPEAACSMLRIFAERQRADGLIAEYIDGNTGEVVDHDFNINDNTPLFVMAVAHHVQTAGHRECLAALYEPARRAGELILRMRDERGLVQCTNDGLGVRAICGWRNVLLNEQITGVVTEVNSECYAALRVLSDLAQLSGQEADAARFRAEAEQLRGRINQHLINPKNGLYVRNIDLEDHSFTEATVDLVFPLICEVADRQTEQRVSARLSEPDFMSADGLRALPVGNPRYDPSAESGCLGGVWPGATWWYAMACAPTSPKIVAESLRRSYWHYVSDPKALNTVPGQFSEWMDGQTLVNRGMRLSPWEAPRFLWAAIEGLAGVKIGLDTVALHPQLPLDWLWLHLGHLPYRGHRLSFFLTRQADGLHLYTAEALESDLVFHHYDEELPNDPAFEQHVAQGPHIVIDDAAPEWYRRDARVHFIPGHPVLHNMYPELLRGLGLTVPGRLTKLGQEWLRAAEARLLYVPPAQTAKDLGKVALAALGAGAFGWLALRWLHNGRLARAGGSRARSD